MNLHVKAFIVEWKHTHLSILTVGKNAKAIDVREIKEKDIRSQCKSTVAHGHDSEFFGGWVFFRRLSKRFGFGGPNIKKLLYTNWTQKGMHRVIAYVVRLVLVLLLHVLNISLSF